MRASPLVHLKSLTLKGFKSFPDRTRMEFGPGVSVIVGPNGSGKSNVTDAVLWVMGEQSPLAVRGRSMQDIIFSGGRGQQARPSAEVEVVLDNSDGAIDLPLGEISISRKLDRNGDGEYRINGAKCRLVDVMELLSDTGLGKEAHSVISQGKIEAIVTSKPRDRRLLIEEAAGLGKHRKRRRRAQLKLDRTQENLDRALDVEREARSRLKPLKRQAEAADLHERLQRQEREARWELVRDDLRGRAEDRTTAESEASKQREAQREGQQQLEAVAERRQKAEEALAARSEQRERLTSRVERARSAGERVEMRRDRARETAERLAARAERGTAELEQLRALAEQDAAHGDSEATGRIEALERRLEELDRDRAAALDRELAALSTQRDEATARVGAAEAELQQAEQGIAGADEACAVARQAQAAAKRSADEARSAAADVGAALARANQFLRSASGPAVDGASALADKLEVTTGLELALSAALGASLSATVAETREEAARLLDKAGGEGGRALVVGSARVRPDGAPPVAGAVALAGEIRGSDSGAELARKLLAGVWLVDDLDAVKDGFDGVAVTRAGRAWVSSTGELRQAAEGGAERVLAVRNERDRLIAEMEAAAQAEQAAQAALTTADAAFTAAQASREAADDVRRAAARALAEVNESVRQLQWLIEERRKAPEQGEAAVQRAQLEGELAAERRVAEQAERQRQQRAERIASLEARVARDSALGPAAAKLADALSDLHQAVVARAAILEAELESDRSAGEGIANELRACATEEASVQQRLRQIAELVTGAEVRAQQARDAEAEASREIAELAEQLGLEAGPREEALGEDERATLQAKRERLVRRREQLGPVNPLAQQEYEEALAHVEELEAQREDMETALRELRTFIRDTDRQIKETFNTTFEAAAANFEELASTLFPGGSGKLVLTREQVDGDEAAAEDGADELDEVLGVEIEITPAGKSMKRLSLLSGGEKTMTAIAFLFSVFLAKPCPFYILDEVEAALDDRNITRYLDLLAAHAGRAQFIIVTHQKRTMEAADTLYGVSMGGDGVSQVVSRRMTDAALEERIVVPV